MGGTGRATPRRVAVNGGNGGGRAAAPVTPSQHQQQRCRAIHASSHRGAGAGPAVFPTASAIAPAVLAPRRRQGRNASESEHDDVVVDHRRLATRAGGKGGGAFGDAEDLMKKYGDAAQATGQFIGKQSGAKVKPSRGKRGVGAGSYDGNGVFLLLLVNVALFVADQWQGCVFLFTFCFLSFATNSFHSLHSRQLLLWYHSIPLAATSAVTPRGVRNTRAVVLKQFIPEAIYRIDKSDESVNNIS
jgi:hypothetical protein